jgi:hypothetical protein
LLTLIRFCPPFVDSHPTLPCRADAPTRESHVHRLTAQAASAGIPFCAKMMRAVTVALRLRLDSRNAEARLRARGGMAADAVQR